MPQGPILVTAAPVKNSASWEAGRTQLRLAFSINGPWKPQNLPPSNPHTVFDASDSAHICADYEADIEALTEAKE